MSQQPGSGSGPQGPQNPIGQQPGQNPYGSSPTPPQGTPAYGSQPTPPQGTPGYGAQPTPPQQPPAYGRQPQQPSPYGQASPPQPAYGQPQQPQPPYGQPQQPQPYGQQPPQSPYGASPTPPPQAAPYGAAATPTYGAGSSGPLPYGPAPTQGYPPVPGAYPLAAPAKKKSRAGLVIGVIAAVLVLLVGGGYLVSQTLKKPVAAVPITTPSAPTMTKAPTTSTSSSASPSGSSSASGYPGLTQSGSTLTGSNFTTTLPTGWTLSASNGGKNEGEIIDPDNNLIDYFSDFQRTATENCAYQASSIASASGVESAQPAAPVDGVMWGGDPATGVEVTLKRSSQTQQEVIGYYCLDHAGTSVLVRSISWAANKSTVREGAKQFLLAWMWS